MKIRFRNKHMNFNLIFGLIWLAWFFIGMFSKEKPHWTDYGWAAISATYLIGYFYQRKNKYLTIKSGILKVNGPFGKEVRLTDIKRIKKFAGDYILKTDNTKLTINTQIIEPHSLVKLNTVLQKLNVEWN